MHRSALSGLGLFMFSLLGSSISAAAEPGARVMAEAAANIERPPQVMRLQMEVFAKSADVKDAIARLNKRKAQCEKLLTEMGATKESLHFGTPHVAQQVEQTQRQMRMMVIQQLRARGRKNVKPTAAIPVTLAMSVEAEWPIDGADRDAMVVKSYELKRKIEDADLAGIKEVTTPTEDQEELEEEGQDLGNYFDQSQQELGAPAFVYVAKISEKEHQSAMADAFGQAKQKATDLATAAGAKLGDLQELKSVEQSGTDMQDYSAARFYGSAEYRMAQQLSGRSLSSGQAEAIGIEPGAVRFGISVSVTFSLK